MLDTWGHPRLYWAYDKTEKPVSYFASGFDSPYNKWFLMKLDTYYHYSSIETVLKICTFVVLGN